MNAKTQATQLRKKELINAAHALYDRVISEVGNTTKGHVKAWAAVEMHFDKLKKKDVRNKSMYDNVYFLFRQERRTL